MSSGGPGSDRSRRLLVTGGRAPGTLEMIRLLHRAGHTVFLAESFRFPISRGSRGCRKVFRVPPPRQALEAFLESVRELVVAESIEVILPTCEEVFHLARGRERFDLGCDLFAAPWQVLRDLHSKKNFIDRAREAGLDAPETVRVTEREELLEAVRQRSQGCVVKPEFSRFATRVLMNPLPEALGEIEIGSEIPWVVQERLEGKAHATWSVAHHGRVTAHGAYDIDFVAGGAAIHFSPLEHSGSRSWVEKFVAATGFTGQIAFDFIEVPGRGPLAIECNPRLTSGIHLFGDDPGVCEAFFEPDLSVRTPPTSRPSMLAIPMFLYGLPSVRSLGDLRRWSSIFLRGRDIVFRGSDPMPAILQGLSLAELAWLALRTRRGLVAASTWDIEYDGVED